VHLLLAFEQGADGVMVAGCLEGDCHYQVGNLRAKKRVQRVKDILDKVGVNGGRLEMYNLSAGQGTRFAEIARDIYARVMELGPSPIRVAKEKAVRPIVEVAA
jgi:coenzyme F420-reducing hydrogenase delta subunit